MSLLGALSSAVSALSAQSETLSNISNNLANSSTTAYKASSTSFSSLVAGSSGSDGGVAATTRSNNSEQGTLVSSSSDTDLAIDGDGYFVVEDSDGDTYYTRDGEFEIDSDGYLSNDGYVLMGWATDADGNIIGSTSSSSLVAIDTDSITSSVGATTEEEFSANLPADAETDDAYETTFEVYDSLGTASTVTATWTKTDDDNTWVLSLSDATDSDGTDTGTVTLADANYDSDGDGEYDSILVTFNDDGTIDSPDDIDVSITDWTTGAADSDISIDISGLTQLTTGDEDSSVTLTYTQDGLAYGDLTGITIDDDGNVIASFDNGEERTIYKIAVATFANVDGLTESSDGMYSRSTTSGSAVLQTANSGSAGSINSGWLESSTTDTSTEFSSMLEAQQAYSSSSQVMSAVNSMFQTLLQAVA